jgi:(E)-4-hydroxy-3-methylbut-2-enyl-diphosphate synthase
LGVTEAGDGEDGRVKSAVGIGALLEDGLGDTIRVSLTEDPEAEIPVAQELVARYPRTGTGSNTAGSAQSCIPMDPFSYGRRHTREAINIGARHVPVVIADHEQQDSHHASFLLRVGLSLQRAERTNGTSRTRPATMPTSARTASTSRSPVRWASSKTTLFG